MLSDSLLGLFIILCWIFPFQAVTQQGSTHVFKSAPVLLPKVFVIGLSKTGTTSVGDALELLSYRRTGWEDIRNRFLFQAYQTGDLSFLYDHTFDFDAFDDLPWSLVYREMASFYPDAKFILTLRMSDDAWLKSIKHHIKDRNFTGHELIYGVEEVFGNEEMYLMAYRNHTDSVREYFASHGRAGRLLEFVIDRPDISKGEKWSRLCEFLGLSDGVKMIMRQLDFPYSDAAPNTEDEMGVPHVLEKMRTMIEAGLAKAVHGLAWLTATVL